MLIAKYPGIAVTAEFGDGPEKYDTRATLAFRIAVTSRSQSPSGPVTALGGSGTRAGKLPATRSHCDEESKQPIPLPVTEYLKEGIARGQVGIIHDL